MRSSRTKEGALRHSFRLQRTARAVPWASWVGPQSICWDVLKLGAAPSGECARRLADSPQMPGSTLLLPCPATPPTPLPCTLQGHGPKQVPSRLGAASGSTSSRELQRNGGAG